MNKWGKKFWLDLLERVASTAIAGALAIITAENTNLANWANLEVWLTFVGVPALVSLLKGLAVNFTAGHQVPTASAVGVTSTTKAA